VSDTRTADEAAIHRLFDRINQAWTDADAATFAAGFTEDADYTTFVGSHYRGRAKIAEMHHALWQRFLNGSRLLGAVTAIHFLTADVAVVTSVGRVQRHRLSSSRPDKAQTLIAVRHDADWLFAAFHNCKRRPLLEWIANRTDPRLAPNTPPIQRLHLAAR
jgi:uncharacterized protein (TIGR02246 family)